MLRSCEDRYSRRTKQLIAVGILAPSVARVFAPELIDLSNFAAIVASLIWLWET